MTLRNALETPSIHQRVGDEEWQARVELAVAYRLVARHGWTNLVNNHISLTRCRARPFPRSIAGLIAVRR